MQDGMGKESLDGHGVGLYSIHELLVCIEKSKLGYKTRKQIQVHLSFKPTDTSESPLHPVWPDPSNDQPEKAGPGSKALHLESNSKFQLTARIRAGQTVRY
jgi:hypothetical protein